MLFDILQIDIPNVYIATLVLNEKCEKFQWKEEKEANKCDVSFAPFHGFSQPLVGVTSITLFIFYL